jgi:hypothetical protein
MNWKIYGRKRSWSNLRSYLNICLDSLRGTVVNFNNKSLTLNRDLDPETPEYEELVLFPRP